MTSGNGKASKTTCVRCRAMELGLAGRPLTRDELILVHGGVVEPSRENRVQWAADTVEAAISVDAAEGAYQAAREVFAEIGRDAVAQLERLRRTAPVGRQGREVELEAVIDAAREELGEAEKQLVATRRRYRASAANDSEQHRLTLARESAAAVAEQREARKAGRKNLVARMRG